MTDFRFYLGCASGSQRKAVKQLEVQNVMINYATQNNKPWEGIQRLFIDSGGYSFMKGKGEYKTSNREYLSFVEKYQPKLFALRDYPCEPEILKNHGRTVEEHQKMTIQKHKEILEIMDDYNINSQPISIVQGWKLRDYLNQIEVMKEEDLLTEYVAIGSICRRGQSKKIKNIICSVKKELPDKKLHAFGIKANVLQFPSVVESLDSADSLASSMNVLYNYKDSKVPPWWQETKGYIEFYDKIMKLVNGNNTQKTIGEVMEAD